MTLLSLCLAAAAAVSAQTAPPAASVVFEHPAKAARLVLLTPAGESRPHGVYYDGPKGRWLLRDLDFEAVGYDRAAYDLLTRYEIYVPLRQGLSYREDSNVTAPSLYRWDDDAVIAAVETVVSKLSYGEARKKEAALECQLRSDTLSRYASRLEGQRLSFESAYQLAPGSISDPKRLADMKPQLEAARALVASSTALCRRAVTGTFNAAAPADLAPLFWRAAAEADLAAAQLSAAQYAVDTLPVPAY
jgi:hypothetical protein